MKMNGYLKGYKLAALVQLPVFWDCGLEQTTILWILWVSR